MPRFALCLFLTFPLPLLAAGHDLTKVPPAANQIYPVVTGNGSGFTTAWMESAISRNAVVSSVVSAGGEPIEGAGAAIDQQPVRSVAIAHSPTETLVVWVADQNVFAERLSLSGMPLNTIVLTSDKPYPSSVAVAWNGSRYFVVWSNQFQLLGAFIAPDGSATPPHALFSEPSINAQSAPTELPVMPDVAWDGRNFIVVFADLPNLICYTLCPSPNPDQFRVMRVSADGDAIDSAPLVIAGAHVMAHVASSGTESLITLDSFGQVSTIIAHDQGGLTLEAETPLFRWFSDVSSAVVWDGSAYTVGWRYVGHTPGPSWMGVAHVTTSGLPFAYRFTAAGSAFPYGGTTSWGRPSAAVNETGITAFTISEATAPSSFVRARLYLASELAPMPAPPPAPGNVVNYVSGNTARIDWQSETADGFAVEWSWDSGKSWSVYATVSGDARTTTVYARPGIQFRVRALGPGGMSAGTVTSIASPQRRRASH